MNYFFKYIILPTLAILLTFQTVEAQKKYVYPKPPKFTLTFALSYNYALARAYGDLSSANVVFDSLANGYVFKGPNYGMLQGGGFISTGKLAVDKKRMFRLTMTLGYNLFYNTAIDNSNRSQWHLFNGTLGVEYNFAPKSKYRPYIGYELMYSLMFGSWRYGVTDPDGIESEVNLKFKPAHRFGMAFNSGVEYMIKRKIGVTFGGRIVWVNLAPKLNKASDDPNNVYINDAKYDNSINIGFRKQIVYFQFVTGLSLYIRRK